MADLPLNLYNKLANNVVYLVICNSSKSIPAYVQGGGLKVLIVFQLLSSLFDWISNYYYDIALCRQIQIF